MCLLGNEFNKEIYDENYVCILREQCLKFYIEMKGIKFKFRLLNAGEKAPWRQATTFSELIWSAAYEICIVDDDKSHGLPFCFADDDMVTLVVKNHEEDDALQKNRVIVQTLTRVERITGSVYTYTRTRRYTNGVHAWGEWEHLSNESSGSAQISNGTVTLEKLSEDIRETVESPLRPLFIASGALYNGTDVEIVRTAPWGEDVVHRVGCYYLNGLGDISEEDMVNIYNHKDVVYRFNLPRVCESAQFRTTLGVLNNTSVSALPIMSYNSFAGNRMLEVAIWFNKINLDNTINLERISASSTMNHTFANCSNLKYVHPINVKNTTQFINTFFGCVSLQEIRLYNLKANLDLKSSALISKKSVLCAVENSLTDIAIVIILHPEVYASLADDVDVATALESQPLVSLVSA